MKTPINHNHEAPAKTPQTGQAPQYMTNAQTPAPQNATQPDEIPNGKRLSVLDTACGWILSLIAHLVLLLLFGGMTLISSDGDGVSPQDGNEVEIIYDNSEQESIESDQDTQIDISQDSSSSSVQTDLSEVIQKPEIKTITADSNPTEGATKISQLSPMNQDTMTISSKSVRSGNWGEYGTSGKGNSGGFFGLSSEGSKIVYIIDLSGSMSQPTGLRNRNSRIDEARDELIRSIQALNRSSKFYVMFYNDIVLKMKIKDQEGRLIEEQLVRATSRNKRQAIQWIKEVTKNPVDGTRPGAAIEIAFNRLRPDQIFFLSDGEFSAKVVDDVRRLYGIRRIKVSTISFFSNEGEANLKAIQKATGGGFKKIDRDMLNGGP